MKKLYALALLVALALTALALTVPAPAAAKPADDKASGINVGETVEDFSLPDTDGREHTLSSLKGQNGTVLIFISVQCPVSNAYNERMEKLAQDYQARGVNVVGINANVTESPEAVKRHAAEKGLTFPILKDKGNKIADRLGALVTPEAFLLDTHNRLVYHGRIDNADPRRGNPVTSDDLRNAIEEMLAGRPVAKTEGKAFGCTIKRVS